MEKKLTNSGPLREPADKHSICTIKMTPAKLRLAMAAMGQPETKVSALCKELGITRQTLYRHVGPQGELHRDGHNSSGLGWLAEGEPVPRCVVLPA